MCLFLAPACSTVSEEGRVGQQRRAEDQVWEECAQCRGEVSTECRLPFLLLLLLPYSPLSLSLSSLELTFAHSPALFSHARTPAHPLKSACTAALHQHCHRSRSGDQGARSDACNHCHHGRQRACWSVLPPPPPTYTIAIATTATRCLIKSLVGGCWASSACRSGSLFISHPPLLMQCFLSVMTTSLF